MIESLEASLPNDGSEAGECIRQEIIILKNKKSLIMRNPSILVQGNSNKRSAEAGDDHQNKKARADVVQTPVTTFNNPKASLTTTPNSFSINQLLTPPSTFTPLTSSSIVGTDEKDYRAFTHPHLLSSMPFPPESKHTDGRASYSSPLTSYLAPEDEPRHLDGTTSLLHPPSTDPYYYHKAALAYQYYPRQMLPPSYPPPPHMLSPPPHMARNPYYPFGVTHDSPRQQQLTLTNEAHNEQQQPAEGQEGERAAQAQPTTQQQQQQQPITQQQQPAQQQLQQMQQKQIQRPQPAQASQEAPLPKIDMYKFNRPASPSSSSSSSLPPYPPADMSHYYFSQFPQQQRLHQQQ